ncbi:putative camp independent regulatory protein [Ilyonectria robusta]
MEESPLLQPTWRGLVKSIDDARILVEACLRGKLAHAPRSPFQSEVGRLKWNGMVFVVELSCSGRWCDHAAWTTVEQDGLFHIQSHHGLRKRTIGLSFQDITHFVIAYDNPESVDQNPLATPSECTTLQKLPVRDELQVQIGPYPLA